MHDDSLYRFSLKCIIRNDDGEILVVKEAGRDFWDLPGGGMDHGESITSAIARELHEEVGYEGSFTYQVIGLDEPVKLLSREVWQIRAIIAVQTDNMTFSVGVDADEIRFVRPEVFETSGLEIEKKLSAYARLIQPATQAA